MTRESTRIVRVIAPAAGQVVYGPDFPVPPGRTVAISVSTGNLGRVAWSLTDDLRYNKVYQNGAPNPDPRLEPVNVNSLTEISVISETFAGDGIDVIIDGSDV